MTAIHPEDDFVRVIKGEDMAVGDSKEEVRSMTGQEIIEIPRAEDNAGTGQTNALLAFANAQRNIGKIAKTGKNPHFNSKYVELSALIDATQDALEANHLFVIQTPQMNEQSDFVLETLIMHENGSLAARSIWPIKAKDMNDPQKVGGAMTYARRYSLMALMNVAGDDDDGNLASQPAKPEPNDELKSLLVENAVKPEDFKARLQKEYKKSKLSELTAAEVKKEIKFYKDEGSPAPF